MLGPLMMVPDRPKPPRVEQVQKLDHENLMLLSLVNAARSHETNAFVAWKSEREVKDCLTATAMAARLYGDLISASYAMKKNGQNSKLVNARREAFFRGQHLNKQPPPTENTGKVGDKLGETEDNLDPRPDISLSDPLGMFDGLRGQLDEVQSIHHEVTVVRGVQIEQSWGTQQRQEAMLLSTWALLQQKRKMEQQVLADLRVVKANELLMREGRTAEAAERAGGVKRTLDAWVAQMELARAEAAR